MIFLETLKGLLMFLGAAALLVFVVIGVEMAVMIAMQIASGMREGFRRKGQERSDGTDDIEKNEQA